MSPVTYILRSLLNRRAASATCLLGIITGSAVLTGALLVGDSMRGSLRERALARLGRVDYALTAPRFFRPELQQALIGEPPPSSDRWSQTAPVILIRGSATHATNGMRANGVQVAGVDSAFWTLDGPSASPAQRDPQAGPTDSDPSPSMEPGTCWITEPLSGDLHANVGDEILLSFSAPSNVPTEFLLGRRDKTLAQSRVRIAAVVPEAGLSGFTLLTAGASPRNVFLRLDELQRALDQDRRVNTILAAVTLEGNQDPDRHDAASVKALNPLLDLEDLQVRLRPAEDQASVAFESDRLLLEPAAEQAALSAAQALDLPLTRILAYLANDIETDDNGKAVPYSIVAGLEAPASWWAGVKDTDGRPVRAVADDELLLNAWAAKQLEAGVGDGVTLRYFVSQGVSGLQTQEARFRVTAILPMEGPTLDPGLTPEYRGITDARRLSDWDPPFPFDFKKIREEDETYWRQHRAAPKAFIGLARAQDLWADQPQRHGRLTSMRLHAAPGESAAALAARFRVEFLRHVDPAAFGYAIEPVRERALAASRGATDFSGLFVGFSFFLIASSAMLVGLLFRLGVERRASELGLLAAVGVPPARIHRLLLGEGAFLAVSGALLGLPAACGYAWLILTGLRTWWSGAVQAPFLSLHVAPSSLVQGGLASILVALLSMELSIRGMLKLSTRALLSALPPPQRGLAQAARRLNIAGLVLMILALATLAYAWAQRRGEHAALMFFAIGVLTLVAGLMIFAGRMGRRGRRPYLRPGLMIPLHLGARNAARHRGRSLLTVLLIASASFLITALQAFRLQGDVPSAASSAAPRLDTGRGGFALLAESTAPLPYDLRTPRGQEDLNLSDETRSLLAQARVFPFRLQSGDEASCLGLYAPSRPRIIGAGREFVSRGGFKFADALLEHQPSGNPWVLLEAPPEGQAIPAIGDESAVRWQLHSGLGRTFQITDESGRTAALRFVALLKGSALQSELIVSEANFTRLFPSTTGHGFFLIEAPGGVEAALEEHLERDLGRFGLEVTRVERRRQSYFAVQNTYLATFQTLGGFGLVLGTIGLIVVLLRNVLERRSELALMQALGFSRQALSMMVLAENAILVLAGLTIGTIAAGLAVAPHLASDPSSVAGSALLATLLGVLAVTFGAGSLALWPVLRAPLIAALRRE